MSESPVSMLTSTRTVRDVLVTVGLACIGIEFVNWVRKHENYKSVATFICSYPGWSLFGATSFGCVTWLFARPVFNLLRGTPALDAPLEM